MTTQNVQVFIRSTEMSDQNPLVIACYPASRPVPVDTHGDGMSVLTLPIEAIKQPALGVEGIRLPMLADNWQSYPQSVTAEATRRVEEAFTTSEQIASLHQTIEDIQKYGTDLSKWPLEARQAKAKTDEKWKYVDEVNARAQAHAASRPFDPSSDKVWPTPPKK